MGEAMTFTPSEIEAARSSPRVGDQYEKGAEWREIYKFDVVGSRVTYVGNRRCDSTINLTSWKRWTRTATLVRRGPETPKPPRSS